MLFAYKYKIAQKFYLLCVYYRYSVARFRHCIYSFESLDNCFPVATRRDDAAINFHNDTKYYPAALSVFSPGRRDTQDENRSRCRGNRDN